MVSPSFSFSFYQRISSQLAYFFLQSGSTTDYTIIDYFFVFLGPATVLFFTFYLWWSGKRKNHKIMRITQESLLQVFSKEFEDLVMEQMSSNGGLLFPKYKKSALIPFKDFRIVFALEERHLMLSVIISWFSGAKDYVALEANPKRGKIPTKIQIIPKKEEGQIKKHQDLLFTLDEIELGVRQLDETYIWKASSNRSGLYFLSEKALLKNIHKMRDFLVRISIDSSDDPSIRIYVKINKDLDLEQLYITFMALCERVDQVVDKTIMKKTRN